MDDFIAALPVKEMHDLYQAICFKGKEECVHNFFWMMRWLRTCMELSEVRHDPVETIVFVFADAYCAENSD